jgi:hypothetical protein
VHHVTIFDAGRRRRRLNSLLENYCYLCQYIQYQKIRGIGETARALGVSITSLRRWEAAGRPAAEQTAGGHRRYDLAKLRPEMFRAAAGVKALSTGATIPGPNATKALLGLLRRLSRTLSRQQKGSANHRTAQSKSGRLHSSIAVIRADAQHKLTTSLARRFHTLGIEDLNVRGMVKAATWATWAFFEFAWQLEYRAAMRSAGVVVGVRFYASRTTCSAWGHKLDALPLSVRAWSCPNCGSLHDRDVNAARNLRALGLPLSAGLPRVPPDVQPIEGEAQARAGPAT